MTQITGGKVLFSETKQIAQYEPRRVEVELTFSVAEGESADEFLNTVGEKARLKVLELLSGSKPAPVAKPALVKETEPKPKGTARGKRSDAKPGAAQSLTLEVLRDGPPRSMKEITNGLPELDPFEETPELKAADDQTVANLEKALAQPAEGEAWEEPAAEEITDAILSSECAKKAAFFQKKDGQNNAAAIRGVIQKFSAKNLPQVSSIDQDRRQDFLDALAKL